MRKRRPEVETLLAQLDGYVLACKDCRFAQRERLIRELRYNVDVAENYERHGMEGHAVNTLRPPINAIRKHFPVKYPDAILGFITTIVHLFPNDVVAGKPKTPYERNMSILRQINGEPLEN